MLTQNSQAQKSAIELDRLYKNVHVSDVNTLISENAHIRLWGIEKVDNISGIFNLKVRKFLESKINGKSILCTLKHKESTGVVAQCTNKEQQDLSLLLLQEGYVSVDRLAVQGSIFETPYFDAENRSRDAEEGIWGNAGFSGNNADFHSTNLMIGVVVLMSLFILALLILSSMMIKGFRTVADAQTLSLDLANKEKSLKDKERYVMGAMISSEIIENKSKIEAYLMIYERVLEDLNDENRSQQYKKTGEVIQKQPALSRSVFDGNTNKLDLFGSTLSSHIIHYYARIKTAPDYIEVTPEDTSEEVQEIAKMSVENAKKLLENSEQVLKAFIDHGVLKLPGASA